MYTNTTTVTNLLALTAHNARLYFIMFMMMICNLWLEDVINYWLIIIIIKSLRFAAAFLPNVNNNLTEYILSLKTFSLDGILMMWLNNKWEMSELVFVGR